MLILGTESVPRWGSESFSSAGDSEAGVSNTLVAGVEGEVMEGDGVKGDELIAGVAGDALVVAVRGRGAGVSNMLGGAVTDEVKRGIGGLVTILGEPDVFMVITG